MLTAAKFIFSIKMQKIIFLLNLMKNIYIFFFTIAGSIIICNPFKQKLNN